MFAKSVIVAALVAFAAATPLAIRTETSQCNTGPVQCCNQVMEKDDTRVHSLTGLLGVLGISIGEVTGLVGLNCSPLSVIGVGGNSCSSQPVCCTDNNFNGLVNVGCSPINVAL